MTKPTIAKIDYKNYNQKPVIQQLSLFDDLPEIQLFYDPPKSHFSQSDDSFLWRNDDKERKKLSEYGLGFLLDLGVLTMNSNKIGFHRKYRSEKLSTEKNIAFLLGLLAEGLVVRECHQSQENNAKWAYIAKRIISESCEENTQFYKSL